NYSISGSRTNFLDSVEVAFLFAADAGVFVAASAGNSGPSASTVAHPGPWLTTVAASTHDRNYDADLTLGSGDTYTGASTNTTGAGPADLVYSANVGLAGEDPTEVRLCYPGTLDPALVTGKIVLCDRGTIARVDKSLAVFMAGGVGSILANANAGDSLNPDIHSVPTVHVDKASGDAIRTYALTDPTPTAEIFPSYFSPAPAPNIAGFSSRGPLLAGGGDLLKPDVSAPGVDVLAAVAPPGNGGQDFASYQGTSMSSPHVAGLAALLTELHPDWSPMMIKSALMTTGFDLLSGADPFAQGAGHVDPNKAADPGLVYDAGWNDWMDFLFGSEPSNLNSASFAIGVLPGSKTLTRTVTSVADTTETYTFSAAVAGVDVTATPSSFAIAPGESITYDVTFTANGAPFNEYATGFVTWTGDNGHVVRSPVAVRPTALLSPETVAGEVDGNGDGSVEVPVDFYYTGPYNAALEGFAEEFTYVSSTLSPPGVAYCAGIGVGLTHLRVATHDADVGNPGQDDLDLRVYFNNACSFTGATLLGSSGGFTSEEVVDIPNSPAGVYILVVDYYDGPDGTIDYALNLNLVLGDEGNGSVTAPASATDGTSDAITVDYTGLNLGSYYLGVLRQDKGAVEVGRTVIDINTN
ncbi:MAG: S8 family serine peptidase, partial [Gammaproteobacteria bacterium]|nr:S8 family serine peptidase [Gammaproteobacteria bacterium]